MSKKIHATAIVDLNANIANNVEIGPYSIIGPEVEIGEGTWIGPHVVIGGPCKIGKHNKIFQFASVGEGPQDLSFKGENTRLEIGDYNIIREYATIHRGTIKDKGLTKIGSRNLFMVSTHIAHDCIIHNDSLFLNNASLAGHVEVEHHAIIGAFCAIHQFSRIGAYSFTTRACMVTQDIPPYLLVVGPTMQVIGLNKVGLERNGFSKESIHYLLRAYKLLYRKKLLLGTALEELKTLAINCNEVQLLINFIQKSQTGRGIARPIDNAE